MSSTALPAVLAVDGGGTKTDVALVNQQGKMLYRAQGAGCNPFDQPRWQEILTDLLTPLPQPYQAAALGLPGYGEAPQFTAQQQAFAATLGVPVVTLNDVQAAQQGAFLGGPGVLILAGTGSMAWGQGAAGDSVRVGGWGELLGDEGSAYWTGLRALNSLTRALDGRIARVTLHERLLHEINQNSQYQSSDKAQAVLSWVAGLSHARSSIAALALTVEQAAQAGDELARQLLQAAAAELATLAQTARRCLPDAGLRWSLAGTFTRSQTVRETLLEKLGSADFQVPALPPLGGVTWLAARQAGWNVSADWIKTLQGQL